MLTTKEQGRKGKVYRVTVGEEKGLSRSWYLLRWVALFCNVKLFCNSQNGIICKTFKMATLHVCTGVSYLEQRGLLMCNHA